MRDSKAWQSGSTLIEVLIAILVLSFGLLGALKLQTEGVKQNADSRYTVMAAAFAQDALDALSFNMRDDRTTWVTITSASDPSAMTGRASEWLTALQRDLPAGKAAVGCSADDHRCTVSISWVPPGGSEVTANYEMYD
jgi:type IV pilus assembly protein PilV